MFAGWLSQPHVLMVLMLRTILGLRDQLGDVVAKLEVDCLDGAMAKQFVVVFAEIERIAVAGKVLAAGRVEATGVWASHGAKSSADWLADVSGTALGPAIDAIEVARDLNECPETESNLRQGVLSLPQAREITRAVRKNPKAEKDLIGVAKRSRLAELKREAERVKAAARTAEDEVARALRHRSLRSLRFWRDDDGMECGAFRLEPAQGVAFRKRLEAEATKLFNAARRCGVRDTSEQYAADALVGLVAPGAASEDCSTATADSGFTDRAPGVHSSAAPQPSAAHAPEAEPASSTQPAAQTHAPGAERTRPAAANAGVNVELCVVVDYEALLRGDLAEGERCEIPGVGPISVRHAREYLLGGAFLKVLIAKGVDIRTVCHFGRHIPAELKTAIAYRDPACVVVGCNRDKGLERHHVVGVAADGETSLFNLRHVCEHDHDLVTHHGYTLGPPDHNGKCQLIAPKPKSSAA